MAAVLRSPSHLPSSPSSSLSNDGPPRYSTTLLSDDLSTAVERGSEEEETERRKERSRQEEKEEEEQQQQQENQLSILALLVAVFRKSLVSCRTEREGDLMEIGWPSNVRHVAHVTFDRFHGFLGLPVEFEPEVPRKAPSASASVFGVSTESMQCSFDCRGNSIPTILLLMQRRLYAQGGLQAEGIFRINAENDQEENVRGQLNRGIIADGIDVHCLAGLIKAWFRELPNGVLDSLTSEQVMHCQTEDDSVALVKLLPPTEAALLDWAINLMADVVQEENNNKMNAHNIAMVFAPNMTQMDDPLTALIYAVQVMKFLKTLIERTLKERKEVVLECASTSYSDPFDENGHHDPLCLDLETDKEGKPDKVGMGDEYVCSNPCELPPNSSTVDYEVAGSELVPESLREESHSSNNNERHLEVPTQTVSLASSPETTTTGLKPSVYVNTRSSRLKHKKGMKKTKGQQAVLARAPTEKSRGMSLVSRISSRVERVEAWR